ncbi:MAG: hypothetical protein JWP61_2287 [Friedmanniella sp.]|nr:hypothetical protein [Friedmanniella sp.]
MTLHQVQNVPQTDAQAEISFQVSRLTASLVHLEAEARAARTERLPAAGWAPLALESGLSAAQEGFIGGWSPDDVLHQCRAQRQMIGMLQTWLRSYDDEPHLALALALLSAFGDASPARLALP